ncbi:MAG: hypothetical protein CVT77_08630 [Alphaproteobacteria bacterium HGW-Alphaproteobacteria-16]|nr:MAG: hypothetical protein CVT77_08630 [Alphaproteobacteria bacterium HGW-Alphaproteobacteria-16]
MPSTNPIRETQINNRLDQIHRRLSQIADIEAEAAPFKGIGSNGEFDPERQRLIEETDRLLDELQGITGSPKYRPAP